MHLASSASPFPWLRVLIGALTLAASLGLASAPVGWHALQWIGWIPLLWAWEPLGKRASCAAGFVTGVLVQVALFTWLAPAFASYGGAPLGVAWLGFAVYALWEAVPFAILGLWDWALRRHCPNGRWWLLAAAFVGLEWLWPRVFAWRAGAPQIQAAWIAPLAAVLGPLGLSLLVSVVNGGLYAGIRERRVLPLVAAGAALVATLGFGAAWSNQPSSGMELRVGWVQPGIVSRRGENAAEVWQALERGCAVVGDAGGAELCLLPEGISPEPWMELAPNQHAPLWERRLKRQRSALLERFVRLSRRARAPILVGLTRRFVVPRGEDELEIVRRTNACLLVGAEGVLGWTGKRKLLPFAEQLPFAWLRTLVPTAGRYSPAPGKGVLKLDHAATAGVLVCYEAIWSRPFGDAAPGLLLNPTNDDWFTGQGPGLHAMLSRARALEANRPLVRVAATGTSYVLDGRGRVLARAETGAAAGVVALRIGKGETPLTRWGEGWAALLGLLALALPFKRAFGGERSAEPGAS